MGFFGGSATAGTFILALCAWLLANAPHNGEQLWPYLLYGTVFVALLAHLIHVVLEDTLAFGAGWLHGIPLALAAFWLQETPYPWLVYACWAYAAAYILLAPCMTRALARVRRGAGFVHGGHVPRSFDLQDLGIALMIVVAVSGLIMATGLATREWGLYAGVAAFVMWPVTLVIIPWYAALAHADWSMVILVYGGGITGVLLYRTADAQRRRAAQETSTPMSEEP